MFLLSIFVTLICLLSMSEFSLLLGREVIRRGWGEGGGGGIGRTQLSNGYYPTHSMTFTRKSVQILVQHFYPFFRGSIGLIHLPEALTCENTVSALKKNPRCIPDERDRRLSYREHYASLTQNELGQK